jgi:SWI/SNF-related matrix-associated actin-dependent regulator of chromatin subfamily A-like protein 1
VPLELFGYQEVGAAFLAGRKRAGIFDEPGVGKTAVAIRALDNIGALRVMVIAPAAVRRNWVSEFQKFSRRHRRIVMGVTINDFISWQRGHFDVIVTSFEQGTRWSNHIQAECEVLDTVVIDEAHGLRNADTHRGKAILGPKSDGVGGIVQWAAYAWWLTGTPLWGQPSDIRTFLTFCRVMPLSEAAFLRRYFNVRPTTYGSRNTVKSAMVPELRALIGNNSLRRTLAETGVELPPIFFSSALVDGDDRAVTELLLSSPGLDSAIVAALQEGRGLSNLDSDHVATLRRLIGEAKAIPYAAMLLDELRSGLDKCVTFGIHRNALKLARDYLLRHGIDAVVVNGETTTGEDDRNFARFISDPSLRVVLCNVRKAGTGLNMTASCHVDMLESDWTPNGNWQAIKRVYRLTQVRTVRARFITLADSFDEIVNQIVSEKAQAIAAIDGSPILPLA